MSRFDEPLNPSRSTFPSVANDPQDAPLVEPEDELEPPDWLDLDQDEDLRPACNWCATPWQFGGLCDRCAARLEEERRGVEADTKRAAE